jgi:hypothetical protein
MPLIVAAQHQVMGLEGTFRDRLAKFFRTAAK